MKARSLIKEHLMLFSFILSALIQFSVILAVNFSTATGSLDKVFIPMTITPFVEKFDPVVQEEKKVVQETEDKEADVTAEEEKKIPTHQKTAENTGNQNPFANYLPFVRVDEVAKETTSLIPDYPEIARSAGVEGTVVIEAYIDENGIVRMARVVKGIGFGCDEAALKKVQNTRFTPAMYQNKPVAVRQVIPFEFRLR